MVLLLSHIVINRDRENASRNLFNDYFAENPFFSETMFRRRFRMGRPLFLVDMTTLSNGEMESADLGCLVCKKLLLYFECWRMVYHQIPPMSIYPKWSTLFQTIHDLNGPKKKFFAMRQESCRKDVERAFGVLQSRFAIVAGPSRLWNKKVLHDIMTTCIIMHKMIIEDERDENATIEERTEVLSAEVEMTGDDDA